MKSFVHEQKRKFSQEEYVKVVSFTDAQTRAWRYGLPVVVGIACLFWTYTLGLGVLVLIATSVALAAPHLLRIGAVATYHGSAYLHEELTYRVSDLELSVSGSDLRCQCAWRHLGSWREHDGWLILLPNGMPQLLFLVSLLKEAGVYDDVLALARQHASPHQRKEG